MSIEKWYILPQIRLPMQYCNAHFFNDKTRTVCVWLRHNENVICMNAQFSFFFLSLTSLSAFDAICNRSKENGAGAAGRHGVNGIRSVMHHPGKISPSIGRPCLSPKDVPLSGDEFTQFEGQV